MPLEDPVSDRRQKTWRAERAEHKVLERQTVNYPRSSPRPWEPELSSHKGQRMAMIKLLGSRIPTKTKGSASRENCGIDDPQSNADYTSYQPLCA